MNEANVETIFSKKRLSDTKLFLEGEGMALENKFGQPIFGFKGAYIILTC